MDIKTRLEEDKVLFNNFQNNLSRTNVISSLNNSGIYTVEDFINAKSSDFSSGNRKLYTAMSHILKSSYLNETLLYDVILEKKYSLDATGIKECAKDLGTLGLTKDRLSSVVSIVREHLAAEGLCTYNDDNYDAMDYGIYITDHYDVVSNVSSNTFNMEDLIRKLDINASGPNMRQFYIEYMNQKQLEIKQNFNDENDVTVLNELKQELQALIEMQNSIQMQIDTVKNKISIIEGEKKDYGRK